MFNMNTRLSLTFFFGIVLCGHTRHTVEGRSLSENHLPEKRSPSEVDAVVRELVQLLQIQLNQNEKDVVQHDITSPPPVKPDIKIIGSPTNSQLCTNAISYLSDELETMDKRDLVINYVVNYCITPSSTSDVLLLLEYFRRYDQNEYDESWLNWPEFDKILYPLPSTQSSTEDWFSDVFGDVLNEQDNMVDIDDIFSYWNPSENFNPTDSGLTTPYPGASSTDDWFNELFDGNNDIYDFLAEIWNTNETTQPSTPHPAVSSTEDWFDELFGELFEQENGDDQVYDEEDEENEAIEEQFGDTNEKLDNTNNLVNVIETYKRTEMKKRIRQMLEKSISRLTISAMRK